MPETDKEAIQRILGRQTKLIDEGNTLSYEPDGSFEGYEEIVAPCPCRR